VELGGQEGEKEVDGVGESVVDEMVRAEGEERAEPFSIL